MTPDLAIYLRAHSPEVLSYVASNRAALMQTLCDDARSALLGRRISAPSNLGQWSLKRSNSGKDHSYYSTRPPLICSVMGIHLRTDYGGSW